MEQGAIFLHRQIREHWIWDDPLYLKWWLDILLMVNHSDIVKKRNGRLHKYKRGEVNTSLVKLANRWEADRKTVDRFLRLLEADEMITLNKDRQEGTTIKVSNYSAYQTLSKSREDNKRDIDKDIDKDIESTSKGISKAHRKGHKQECKELKEYISSEICSNDVPSSVPKKPNKRVYDHDDRYYKAAAWLALTIEERVAGYKPHTEKQLQNWADEARKIIELDKRDGSVTNRLLVFSQTDAFWAKNILSMGKFREQYDKLLAQCPTGNGEKNTTKPYSGVKDLRDYVG